MSDQIAREEVVSPSGEASLRLHHCQLKVTSGKRCRQEKGTYQLASPILHPPLHPRYFASGPVLSPFPFQRTN